MRVGLNTTIDINILWARVRVINILVRVILALQLGLGKYLGL